MSLLGSIGGLGGSFFDNMQRTGGGGGDVSALAALRQLQGGGKANAAGGATGGANPLQGISLAKLEQMATGEMQRLGDAAQSTLDANRPSAASPRPFNTGSDGPSFASLLGDLVESVDQKGKVASDAAEDVMLGKSDNIHQAMIAMQEAGVAFNLLVEVRNKLVESYKELTRMQV